MLEGRKWAVVLEQWERKPKAEVGSVGAGRGLGEGKGMHPPE